MPDPDYSLYGLGGAKFDLLFGLTENFSADATPAGIDGVLQYASDLFDHGTAEPLAARLVRMLAAMAADPGARIGEVELLGAGGAACAAGAAGTPRRPGARAAPWPSLSRLGAAAARTPTAVVCGEVELSCGRAEHPGEPRWHDG